MRKLLPALCAFGLVAAGCGSSSSSSPGTKTVDVALDFVPNAVHAPLYEAVRTGADRRHGIRIHIVEPGSSPDSLKALLTGRADVAVMDIQDLGIARLKGRDVVGIAALVQRPLGALVSLPTIQRPRDLEGKTVGVSGLPSDPAFVDAIVRHDGGDPKKIKQVTIGFEAVNALLAKKVASVPAFWNAEGVTLKRKGLPVREFKIDDYGAPPWPEVVLATTRSSSTTTATPLQRFIAAVQDGARDRAERPGRDGAGHRQGLGQQGRRPRARAARARCARSSTRSCACSARCSSAGPRSARRSACSAAGRTCPTRSISRWRAETAQVSARRRTIPCAIRAPRGATGLGSHQLRTREVREQDARDQRSCRGPTGRRDRAEPRAHVHGGARTRRRVDAGRVPAPR